jgi:plasmid stabilization system protein ParE|tara:strand:+ start:216 stop:515 length:300 start_codon:yes stop_codon:yes gene_type:complete
VKKEVLISDRAVKAFERIVLSLQGQSLIGAEKVKDEILGRVRKLGEHPKPSAARKAKFDAIEGDFWSVLTHNHRIYYLIEEKRVVVVDIILDVERAAST